MCFLVGNDAHPRRRNCTPVIVQRMQVMFNRVDCAIWRGKCALPATSRQSRVKIAEYHLAAWTHYAGYLRESRPHGSRWQVAYCQSTKDDVEGCRCKRQTHHRRQDSAGAMLG